MLTGSSKKAKKSVKKGEFHMTLGDIIKSYRSKYGLSMDSFSDKSGISKAYISLLEKNKHPKTGKEIAPSIQCIKQAAQGMGMTFDDLFSLLDGKVNISDDTLFDTASNSVVIPVLGRVAAGIPLTASEYIVDTEEIPAAMAADGEYFGLMIKGDSMEPKISNGDVVIVRKQEDADDGDVVIALVNGDDAVCKRLKKYSDGISLISNNPAYEPMYFTNSEITEKPVQIIGKVKELRAKF